MFVKVNTQMEVQNTDTFSLSTDLLDLLQEDTNSVTGSGSFALAAAESLESGSNGCDMSICGTGTVACAGILEVVTWKNQV